MRNNIAVSRDASFEKVRLRWTSKDLPISLPWRSALWRTSVPTLWVLGWAVWILVLNADAPGRSLVFHAVLFIGMPLMLAGSAVWWVQLWRNRQHAGTLVINDDYLEWQSEMGSNVDLLSDCGKFKLVGKRNSDARIEWDVATSWDGTFGAQVKRWLAPDRALYARDMGLDRDDLDSLCKLLNQLRDEVEG